MIFYAVEEQLYHICDWDLGSCGPFWKCKNRIASEDLLDGFPDRLGSGFFRRMGRAEHLQTWWPKVVLLFTSADLTIERHKLPALPGIARRIHREKGGQYVAGLWRNE